MHSLSGISAYAARLIGMVMLWHRPESFSACPHAAAASVKPKATLADDTPSLQIIGEVVEKIRRPRHHGSSAEQAQPEAAPRPAFPAATHRKTSKFSLARKAQTQPQAPAHSVEQPGGPHRDVTGGSSADHIAETPPSIVPPRAPPSSTAEPPHPPGEQAAVDTMMRENDAFISKLSATEVRSW